MIVRSCLLAIMMLMMCILVSCSSGSGNSSDNGAFTLDDPVNQLPSARFVATPTRGDAPLTVSFDASSSSDPDGELVSYDWTFGDGSGGNGIMGVHTYNTVGDYVVFLTVTDNDGLIGRVRLIITVTGDIIQNQLPIASFNASPLMGDAPLTVTLDASGSFDSDGSVVSFAWTFGDGASASGMSTTHTFNAGIYQVTLTVTDDQGATDIALITISANQPGGSQPTPQPTPPSPGPAVGDLEIVSSSLFAGCDFFNEVEILGEIFNRSSTTYYFVEVEGTFRNAAGDVLGVDFTFANGTPIKIAGSGIVTSGFPPNQLGAFKLLTDISCDDVDTYDLELSADSNETMPVNGDIQIVGNVVEQTDFSGDLILSGEVENSGTVTTLFTEVIAVFKNAAGKVIDVDFTFIEGSTCDTRISTTDTCVTSGDREPFEFNTFVQRSDVNDFYLLFDWLE